MNHQPLISKQSSFFSRSTLLGCPSLACENYICVDSCHVPRYSMWNSSLYSINRSVRRDCWSSNSVSPTRILLFSPSISTSVKSSTAKGRGLSSLRPDSVFHGDDFSLVHSVEIVYVVLHVHEQTTLNPYILLGVRNFNFWCTMEVMMLFRLIIVHSRISL